MKRYFFFFKPSSLVAHLDLTFIFIGNFKVKLVLQTELVESEKLKIQMEFESLSAVVQQQKPHPLTKCTSATKLVRHTPWLWLEDFFLFWWSLRVLTDGGISHSFSIFLFLLVCTCQHFFNNSLFLVFLLFLFRTSLIIVCRNQCSCFSGGKGLHGGPPEEQGPPDEGVGGSVFLPGRAQLRVCGAKQRQRQEEPLLRLGSLWASADASAPSVRLQLIYCVSALILQFN